MMFFTRHLPDIEHGDPEADSSWPSWPDSSWPEASGVLAELAMHASRVAASLGSTHSFQVDTMSVRYQRVNFGMGTILGSTKLCAKIDRGRSEGV